MDGDIRASLRGTGCYYTGMCVRVDGSFGVWLNGCAERVAHTCKNEKFLFSLGTIISRSYASPCGMLLYYAYMEI